MDEQRIKFVMHNYSKVRELKMMLEEYIQHMLGAAQEKIRSVHSDSTVRSSVLNWPDGPALQLGLSNWPRDTNITMMLLHDGRFRIQLYVAEIPDDLLDTFWQSLNQSKFGCHRPVRQALSLFGFLETALHEEALREVAKLAENIESLYACKKASLG